MKKISIGHFTAALCIFVFATVAAATTMYGDDFIYALYFKDGLGSFFKNTYDHYMQMNGRAVVHFILEVILLFKDKLFFVVIPLCISLVYITAAYVFKPKNKALFLSSGMSSALFIPCTVMREGFFWMAGAMNYIYPTFMAFIGFYVFLTIKKGKKISLFDILILFLAGASTEQGGALSAGFMILYTIAECKNQDNIKKSFLAIFVVFLGYATVVLSPSTFGRTVTEATETLGLIERLRLIYDFSVGKNAAFLMFEATAILLALSYNQKRRAILLAFSAIMAILKFCEMHFAVGIVMTIVLVTDGFAGMFSTSQRVKIRSIILLGGLASIGMLLFSVTFGYRNVLPGLLILTVIWADIICEKANDRILAPVIIFVAGLVVFLPTSVGYAKNRCIINENLKAIGDGTQDFYYNTGLDLRYSYNQFISDNYYEAAYRRIYNIRDGVKIYLRGDDFEDFCYNGIHCENPIYIKDGQRYFPLRNIVEASNGSIVYNEVDKTTEIVLNGKKAYFDASDNTFKTENSVIDGDAYRLKDRKYGYMTEANLYFSRELYRQLFGIETENRK